MYVLRTSQGIAAALLFMTVLVVAPAVRAETYYVSAGGSDGGLGTRDAPWQSIMHGVTKLRPGDTLIVGAGTYQGFTLREAQTGTEKARIRIIGRGALINRPAEGQQDNINLHSAKYIDIEGFVVTGAPRAGIGAVECSHVHIRHNRTYDNGRWGIFTGFCDDLLIEGNVASGSQREHGVYVSNSAKRAVVRGNILYNNAQNGIHTNGDISMGGDGMTSNALIENNIIFGNGRKGGAGINNDGIRDSVIRNNLLFSNHANGITLYKIDSAAPSTGNRVVHNTIIMPAETRWCIRIVDGSKGNVFKNNICLNAHSYRGGIDISGDSLPGFVSDHNILDGRFTLDDGDSVIRLEEWRRKTGQDKSSQALSADRAKELFIDPERGDFRLKAGSLAIGKADPAFVEREDLEGFGRHSRTPDCGALAYCEGSVCKRVGERVMPGPGAKVLTGADRMHAAVPALLGVAGATEVPGVLGAIEGGEAGRPAPGDAQPSAPSMPPPQSPAHGSGCCKGQVASAPEASSALGLLAFLALLRRRRSFRSRPRL